ncbi:mastermind-like protein 1 [Scomber scombrus]
MERLRRRIELFRQHHNSCESRYEGATLERLELERQQTFSLHQRCLQAKAKRSNKHRQPQQPSSDQTGQRAQGGGAGGGGGGSTELGDSGGTAAEQSRNSTLIALQETVKRKLESASSPLGRDQVNGYGDGFPPNKKSCHDNGTANGSPLDSKLGITDLLVSNGTHPPADSTDGGEPEFLRKEMKQEPDDILPIMPPSGGGNNNSLFPDLNLNEQEWRELMEELNCSVAYEDIQDILNDGFEDRKDPLELAPTPGGAGAVGGGGGGASGGGGQSSQGLLPMELSNVKTEYSPASFEQVQDSRTGSPHVRSTSSGPPPHPTSSPVASSSASSPAMAPSQPAPPPRQLQPPPNHHLQPGPPVPKDLSPAQQLQQLAAQQQRAQHLHSQLQHKQPQPGAKFHPQGPHAHPQAWPQMANPSQSPLGGPFGMDKPTSPSLYPQDFNPNAQKQLLMSGQANKVSPKAGAGGYMPGPAGHPNMLGHPAQGPPLSHPPAPGAQVTAAMLNYNNTKPLSHFEAGPGPRGPPNTQSQNKAALLSLLRQQQMKQKTNMNFTRQHLPHTPDQNSYPAPPHGPGPANTMTSAPGNNTMTAQPGANAMAGNHGNAAYLNSQAVAAALKQQQQQQHQQQILEQQKQQYMQRQQIMVEQEKQRQQDQQLQRHLTRPPPQYQDQPGQPANQNPFPQQPVNQFTASSQPMGSVGSMGGPASGSQRMFPQNQSMLGMALGQGGGPAGVAPPPTGSQGDLSLASCGGGGGGGVDVQQVLYNNMNLHPSHQTHAPPPSHQTHAPPPSHQAHAPPQPGLQRQPLGAMSAAYRQNLLQQHLKQPPNAALLKQQLAARMPGAMQNSLGGNLPGSMPGAMQGGGQSAAWQQQLSNQPPSGNAFPTNANAFHLQQARLSKMQPAGFGGNPGGRPMGGMTPGQQQMMQTNMAAAQQRAPPAPQSLGQPMANQQQTQQQANQSQAVLPDLAAFGQPPGNGRQGLQCNQGYQVSRTASQQQQQVSFGYNVAAGSFAPESELVDSLLKVAVMMLDESVGLAAVTVLGVLEQAYFSLQVIYARRKYSVSPPSTTGPPEFERVFRAQANCSEYFPIFITILWTSGVFFSPGLSSLCGLMYLYGRFRYFRGYSASALERLDPLYFSAQVLWVLIGFSAVGVFLSFCRLYLQTDLMQQLATALNP